jgi:hypothetical protein
MLRIVTHSTAKLNPWSTANSPISLHDTYVQGNPTNGAVGELGWHNRFTYANGNPVNLVDPSGMIAERPERWSGCANSIQFPQLPILGKPLPQSSYGWQCVGTNCQQWLEDAYNILLSSSSPLLQNLAALLDELGRRHTSPTAFHFNLPPGSGAITYSGLLIGIDSGYLLSNPPTKEQIAVAVHELWHTQQAINDRITIWGEVDAYNLETAARRAFGMTISQWRSSLEQYGTPSTVTRDLCSMCQARQCLLSVTNNHWLYSVEPVVNAPWNFLTIAYLPEDCPRFCPHVVPETCT